MITEPYQKISLNIQVAGRIYALAVQQNQQDLLRTIAKELNDRVAQLQLQDDGKDKQDCLAIAVLSWALDFAITQQSELAASREILTELTEENQKIASEKAAWLEKTTLLHTILDAALQK